MSVHRKKLKRFEHNYQLRFLTFSCYRRLPLFQNEAIRDAFVVNLREAQAATHFSLMAWVVMPEHVHLLLMPDLPNHPVTAVLQRTKTSFARRVIHRWRELNAAILPRISDNHGKAHFWQVGGGYDRNIYTSEETQEKFDYIHQNPVTRGLVAVDIDWPWSSAKWYANGRDDWGLQMSHELVW